MVLKSNLPMLPMLPAFLMRVVSNLFSSLFVLMLVLVLVLVGICIVS